jgi:hypothetical protein
MKVEMEITFSEVGRDIHARRATLSLGGVTLFSEEVFDSCWPTGERSEEQAATNLLRVFSHRLSKVLGEPE